MGWERAAVLVASVAFVACSTSSPAQSVDAGSSGDAGAPDAAETDDDWSCLGRLVLPVPSATTIEVRNELLDSVDGKPAVNLSVRACPDRTDPTCAGGTTPVTTDSRGDAKIDVPAGFDGYFEATEPGDVTNLHYLPLPVLRTPFFHDRAEWRAATLKLLTEGVSFKLDATKGQVLMQAHDCTSRSLPDNNRPFDILYARRALAGGVTVTLDPMPAGVVTVYGEIVPTVRLRTDVSVTADAFGGAAFVNVPAGTYVVTAKVAATGARIMSQKIVVRADTFTNMILAPRP